MVKVYNASLQGKRQTNEDEHFIFLNSEKFNKEYNFIDIIGVFDGHGGPLISKYAKNNLPNFFIKKNKELFFNCKFTAKYINKIFKSFNKNLEKSHPRAANYSGTTCCIGIITNDDKGKVLWVINAGDSRAVLHNKSGIAIPLSKDHKPNTPEERDRIESIDGGKEKIYYDGSDWRVVDLSLSRALGDLEANPYVTPLPQVYRYRISNNDKHIILACDGLWDVISNQDAVDFIKKAPKKTNLAKLLAEKAIEHGSTDNVTVIVYKF